MIFGEKIERKVYVNQFFVGGPQSSKFTKVQRGEPQSPKCKGGTSVTKVQRGDHSHQSAKGGPQSPKFTKVQRVDPSDQSAKGGPHSTTSRKKIVSHIVGYSHIADYIHLPVLGLCLKS